MQIIIDAGSYFIFDLDDTLFYEIDYLKSAYGHIAKCIAAYTGVNYYQEMLARYYKGENVFQWIVDNCTEVSFVNKEWLLKEYREHIPDITLNEAVKSLLMQLSKLNIPCGIITDGRSITQRNKLKALGIAHLFTDVIISEEFGSEKPDERNYHYFKTKYPGRNFYFFGDNTRKDFLVPAKFGWQSFCIKNNGAHIHSQALHLLTDKCYLITSFSEIQLIFKNNRNAVS